MLTAGKTYLMKLGPMRTVRAFDDTNVVALNNLKELYFGYKQLLKTKKAPRFAGLIKMSYSPRF